MNLSSIVALLLISMLIVAGWSCKKKSNFLKDDPQYFRDLLTADMDHDDLVEVFGEPPVDLNAEWAATDGLHIYQYPLYDSTFVRIGYTDKIAYACLVDDSSNVVQDILVIDHDNK
jgi:hypothetical protein